MKKALLMVLLSAFFVVQADNYGVVVYTCDTISLGGQNTDTISGCSYKVAGNESNIAFRYWISDTTSDDSVGGKFTFLEETNNAKKYQSNSKIVDNTTDTILVASSPPTALPVGASLRIHGCRKVYPVFTPTTANSRTADDVIAVIEWVITWSK